MIRSIEFPTIQKKFGTIWGINTWKVLNGSYVKVGDTIAILETEHATFEVESFYQGTIQFVAEVGPKYKFGSLLAKVDESNFDTDEYYSKAFNVNLALRGEYMRKVDEVRGDKSREEILLEMLQKLDF